MNHNIFIMGDSYSTYQGYIPEGYNAYYSDERTDAPIVDEVEKTWWKRLVKDLNLNLVQNDSFSGSTICNTVRPTLTVETSFVSRMDKYLAENFFLKNPIDIMLIFGGTNDSWIDAPIGAIKYADWSEEDLKCVLPAFCYLISKAKETVNDILVIINTELKPEITQGFMEACTENGIRYLCLENIDKENGHPTELGMQQIAEQIAKCLRDCL